MGNKTVKLQSQIDLVVAAQAEYDFLWVIDEHPVLYKNNVIYNAIYRYEKYWLPLVAELGCQLLPAPLDVEGSGFVIFCLLFNTERIVLK